MDLGKSRKDFTQHEIRLLEIGSWCRFVRYEAQLDTANTLFSDIGCLFQEFVELLELLKERLRSWQLGIWFSERSCSADAAEGEGVKKMATGSGGP